MKTLRSSTRTTLIPCPNCDRKLVGPQGLAAHKRKAHPEPEPETEPTKPEPANVSTNGAVPLPPNPALTPLDYVTAALQGLETELGTVDAEIERLQELKVYRADLVTQVEAVRKAKAIFGTPSPNHHEAHA